MTFHVGQPVECIDNRGASELSRGAVYTIDAIVNCWGDNDVCPGIELREIVPPETYFRVAYHPARFRPIVARKPDISIFTEMLAPQGVDA